MDVVEREALTFDVEVKGGDSVGLFNPEIVSKYKGLWCSKLSVVNI